MPNQTMPMTTASDAPMFTPRMPGSASGLRVTPCMMAPASPSAAPESRASSVRGRRTATAASATVSTRPLSPPRISAKETSRVPMATESAQSNARSASTAPSHAVRARLERSASSTVVTLPGPDIVTAISRRICRQPLPRDRHSPSIPRKSTAAWGLKRCRADRGPA
ncbi:hypothetical protein D3C72_1393830 [compost metagenome]